MIGEHLREVRKSLHLTQDKMATGIVNRSFYSRVEGGCNSITADALLKLLYAHEISAVDFLQEFGDSEPRMEGYQKKISLAYLNGDVEELQYIQSKLKMRNKKIDQLVKLLIAKLKGNIDGIQYKQLSWDSLKKRELDEESLWLIYYVMDFYKFADLQGLIEAILNKSNFKYVDNRKKQLMAQIAVKYLRICFEKDQLNYGIQKTINFLKRLPDSVELGIYKFEGVYYNHLLHHRNKEAEKIAKVLNN